MDRSTPLTELTVGDFLDILADERPAPVPEIGAVISEYGGRNINDLPGSFIIPYRDDNGENVDQQAAWNSAAQRLIFGLLGFARSPIFIPYRHFIGNPHPGSLYPVDSEEITDHAVLYLPDFTEDAVPSDARIVELARLYTTTARRPE